MRIDNQGIQDLSTAVQSTSANGPTGQSGDSTTPRAALSDEVSLSSGKSLVALAKNSAVSGRQAKIQALQSQVRSGSYHPDLSEVSRALVGELAREGASTSS